jgi:hypothetical protein
LCYRNGWPSPTHYPAICGHEIVGEIVQAGKESGHKVGSRVGVGAQAGSWYVFLILILILLLSASHIFIIHIVDQLSCFQFVYTFNVLS